MHHVVLRRATVFICFCAVCLAAWTALPIGRFGGNLLHPCLHLHHRSLTLSPPTHSPSLLQHQLAAPGASTNTQDAAEALADLFRPPNGCVSVQLQFCTAQLELHKLPRCTETMSPSSISLGSTPAASFEPAASLDLVAESFNGSGSLRLPPPDSYIALLPDEGSDKKVKAETWKVVQGN